MVVNQNFFCQVSYHGHGGLDHVGNGGALVYLADVGEENDISYVCALG